MGGGGGGRGGEWGGAVNQPSQEDFRFHSKTSQRKEAIREMVPLALITQLHVDVL